MSLCECFYEAIVGSKLATFLILIFLYLQVLVEGNRSAHKYNVADPLYAKAIHHLAIGKINQSVSYFMEENVFKELALQEAEKLFVKEADLHCSRGNQSVLMETTQKAVEELSVETIATEIQVG